MFLALPFSFLWAQRQPPAAGSIQFKVIEVKEPDGQILSYRHLSKSTVVLMRGTRLAPQARIFLKVGSRPGYVKVDMNKLSGLKPAYRLGKDYLTYVLWAVSLDGRASNLGEITFKGEKPVGINVTTPYQTFWLMVTAEPNFAVVDPSPEVVMYSVNQDATGKKGKKALAIEGDLFFLTHYTTYQSGSGDAQGKLPNELLQARKAVEMAVQSGAQAADRASAGSKEERYIKESLDQAKTYLAKAEETYKKDAKDLDMVQFARTASQSAENARALATGVAGNLRVRRLENEVAGLRKQAPPVEVEEPEPAPVVSEESPRPQKAPPTPAPPSRLPAIVAQPAAWFALVGWGLALALLFRRKSI